MSDQAPRLTPRDVVGLLIGIVANGSILLGVVVWGWAPGNVWIAFLAESIAVGITTALRLHRLGPRAGGMDRTFWVAWYGGFTGVQAIFVAISAWLTGIRADVTLAIPLVLVLVRFSAEVLDILSGPTQRRPWMLVGPITRMVVLHVGVILGFGLALTSAAEGALDRPVVATPALILTGAAAPVAALMAIKTVAEVGVGVAWATAARRSMR
ncbi:MAG: DUF6498-containing protein [Actinomycetes bacterium]